MRSVGVIVGLVLALGGGLFAFQQSVSRSPAQAPPQQTVDVVGIRQALLAMGQAERRYMVAHSTYGTLEQLAREDLLPGGTDRRGYAFDAVVSGADHFTITATPTNADKAEWPTLAITESMEVSQR